MFDGTLARATGKVSKLGAFMDSVFDRWGEAIVYLGIALGLQASRVGHRSPSSPPRRWAPRSWSATPGPSRRASASPPGTGMAAVGVMPREVRLVILSLGLIVAGDDAPTSPILERAPSAIIAIGATITVIQRILHVRSQARSATTTRPTKGSTENDVSKNGSNGKGGATPTNTWAGAGRRGDGKIRVAIVGVGNCASSLVQGRYYYENAKKDDFVPGLMHVDLGGYHVRDIEFVAAFDIDKNKVGKDLSEAIYTKPNNTYVFQQVAHIGVTVERGMTHDGLGKYLSQIIEKAPGPDGRHRRHPQGARGRRHGLATCRSAARRRPSGTSSRRSRPASASSTPSRCSSAASRTGSAASPRPACRSSATTSRARSARPSRHRVLTRLFMDRGVRLDRTYQLNFGGNTDFLNMLERERLESKKISKTNAVTSMLDYEIDPDDIHVGPCDHVPWLLDRKWCYIRMEGTTFGDVPLNAELKLEVWDSPNSAGVITDAIRCLKLGLDRGLKGTLVAPSSYFMKSPPIQIHDDIAFNRVEAFIRGEDNETLVGTEAPVKKTVKRLAGTKARVAAAAR